MVISRIPYSCRRNTESADNTNTFAILTIGETIKRETEFTKLYFKV